MTLFAFYKDRGDFGDRVVRFVTNSIYSHVEMLREEPKNGSALCISASKRDGNIVRQKSIIFKRGHWDFVEVPNLDVEECWSRATPHLGKPYDIIGAILTVTPVVTSRRGSWFCTELLGEIADIPQPHTLTPKKLEGKFIQMGGYHRSDLDLL